MVKNAFFASAAVAVVVATAVAPTVSAWHPKGVIVKQVQNQTSGGELQDANSANAAVAAKEGDVLRYVITVRNDGKPASNGYNDMAKTVVTDTLPDGVELVANPAQRTLTENLGLIKPQEKVVKEYLVKVTAKDAKVIENKACFTGDSTANDSPQKGCDSAVAKVSVPVKPAEKPEEKPAEKPQEKPAEQAPVSPAVQEVPAEVPATGPEQILGGLTGASALAYAATSYVRSRRLTK